MTARRSLAAQLTAATALVALAAVLVAGALATPLVRGAAEDAVRAPLSRQADLMARAVESAPAGARVGRSSEVVLGRLGLSAGRLGADGSREGEAAAALPAVAADALLAGRPVSTRGQVAGREVLLEGRPLSAGGAVVLAAPADDVDDTTEALRRRLGLALLAGLIGAGLTGALLARRLARPLTQTATAARRLAEGDRSVFPPVEGPREVAAVADALTALDRALQTSEGRQREFLLSVSHELRTPLTAVRGYAEALADGVIPADEVPAAGRTLLAEAARLDRFVADLLALARLEADDLHLHLAQVDLVELVTAAAAVWSARAADRNVPVRTEKPAGPLVVRTDGDRVRQVIDGLAENALRLLQPGQPLVLAVKPAPDGAVVQVRDGGPGLAEEDLAVAFHRGVLHSRYAGTRPVGSGLGLAIVHRLVTRLGGRIEAGRAAEGGAAFTAWLPERPDRPRGSGAPGPSAGRPTG